MTPRLHRHSLWLAALLTFTPAISQVANATIVEFQVGADTFEVNLYDNATPATVANFLDYVNNGRYSGSIFHRTVSNFIVQGGGGGGFGVFALLGLMLACRSGFSAA